MSASAEPTGSAACCDMESEFNDRPLGRSTAAFHWLSTIFVNLEFLFRDRRDVSVDVNRRIHADPDALRIQRVADLCVVFGRPSRDRVSYKVWDEEGIFPQVVFEVGSPDNRMVAMTEKFGFYDRYGAEEYYIVNPEFPMHLEGWQRRNGRLVAIETVNDWVSPKMGIRFELKSEQLSIYHPNGLRFSTCLELVARARDRQRADRLAARLRELGVDPEAI